VEERRRETSQAKHANCFHVNLFFLAARKMVMGYVGSRVSGVAFFQSPERDGSSRSCLIERQKQAKVTHYQYLSQFLGFGVPTIKMQDAILEGNFNLPVLGSAFLRVMMETPHPGRDQSGPYAPPLTCK
jgi:hypothetical protein